MLTYKSSHELTHNSLERNSSQFRMPFKAMQVYIPCKGANLWRMSTEVVIRPRRSEAALTSTECVPCSLAQLRSPSVAITCLQSQPPLICGEIKTVGLGLCMKRTKRWKRKGKKIFPSWTCMSQSHMEKDGRGKRPSAPRGRGGRGVSLKADIVREVV